MKAHPYVKYAEFNQREEGKTRADWLWWWVDRSGECFGCLVQAKNLKWTGRNWSIDFKYRDKSGALQMDKLFATADLLHVPAAYMLYCGDADYRAPIFCDLCKPDRLCKQREGAAVTILTALIPQLEYRSEEIAAWSGNMDIDAITAFHRSIPVEELVLPNPHGPDLSSLMLKGADKHLLNFLQKPQIGARGVARHIFKQVGDLGMGQHAALTADAVDTGQSAVFKNVPGVRGHFGAPHFQHVLRGLRSELPPYVEGVISGESLPLQISDLVDGVAVVYL